MLTVQAVRNLPQNAQSQRETKRSHFVPWRASWYFVVGFLIALASLIVVPFLWANAGNSPGSPYAIWWRMVVFVGSLCAMLTMMCAVGVAITGRRMGILWTARNVYSLSRLQLTMWTFLVMSAVAALVACRAYGLMVPAGSAGMSGALNIDIPSTLLMVMGISLTSAAAAPAILSVKAQTDDVSSQQVSAATARLGTNFNLVGRVVVRDRNYEPLVKDLFQGDEVSKAGTVDMGKVQHAVITLILWTAYFGMLAHLFLTGDDHPTAKTSGTTALPAMSETFVYLLGISHAGYLAFKAAPSPGSAGGAGGQSAAGVPSEVPPRPKSPLITPANALSSTAPLPPPQGQ